jgi:hypothetical protein
MGALKSKPPSSQMSYSTIRNDNRELMRTDRNTRRYTKNGSIHEGAASNPCDALPPRDHQVTGRPSKII